MSELILADADMHAAVLRCPHGKSFWDSGSAMLRGHTSCRIPRRQAWTKVNVLDRRAVLAVCSTPLDTSRVPLPAHNIELHDGTNDRQSY